MTAAVPVARPAERCTNQPERAYVLGVLLEEWCGVDVSYVPQATQRTTIIRLAGSDLELELDEQMLLGPLDRRSPWFEAGLTWVPPGEAADPQKIVDDRGIPVFMGTVDNCFTRRTDNGVQIPATCWGRPSPSSPGSRSRIHHGISMVD